MNEALKLFMRRILIYSAFLAFAGVLVSLIMPAGTITPAMPFLIVFFLCITWAIIWYLTRATEKSFIKFVNSFMITTGLKLLLLIVIVVGYVYFNRTDAFPFIVSFFLLYLFYTAFEVYAVIYLSKRQKKN